MAEMLEGRRSQFKEEIMAQGSTPLQAEKEIQLSIERCVYYSGWCDKYSALYSSVNPVASAHFNFSVPEPMGVVSVIAPEDSSLLGLLSVILPVIAGGNVCVVLASETKPLCSITFAEVLATSDLPAGVVNILTGKSKELHTHFSNHMDVNAVIYCRDNQTEQKTIEENASINVKRSFCWHKDWSNNEHQNPYLIMDLQEIKTTWHPIESIGIGGAKY
jgi:acyl-CoA reductase-like NAD-dependent aldehyde dehydrogenase